MVGPQACAEMAALTDIVLNELGVSPLTMQHFFQNCYAWCTQVQMHSQISKLAKGGGIGFLEVLPDLVNVRLGASVSLALALGHPCACPRAP